MALRGQYKMSSVTGPLQLNLLKFTQGPCALRSLPPSRRSSWTQAAGSRISAGRAREGEKTSARTDREVNVPSAATGGSSACTGSRLPAQTSERGRSRLCARSRFEQPAQVRDARTKVLQFWEGRAQALVQQTEHHLKALADPWLRRLLRGPSTLPERLLQGFSIVGNIERSQRWPMFEKARSHSDRESFAWAWEIRKKVIASHCHEDVKECSSVGPFISEEEVSRFLRIPNPNQRFEVGQNNKVRGCDSAASSMINPIAKISEKLHYHLQISKCRS